ncbi:MAG: hypothetical protein GX590_11365 [Lentisphaerae bacterium]|nr:hypothetical protein [Lentisphaerota bacterium]
MKPSNPPCIVNTTDGSPAMGGLPVAIGVPFPAGAQTDPTTLSVTGPNGESRPAAVLELVQHRDGSIRWGLATFGSRQAAGAAGSRRIPWHAGTQRSVSAERHATFQHESMNHEE